MAAWLADNSFSWSKLKKSITAVWKCNARHAGAPQRHDETLGQRERSEEEEEGAPTTPHLTGLAAEFITSTCYRQQSLKRGPRAGMKPQISLTASTSPSILHRAPSAYSCSVLRSPPHTPHTHGIHAALKYSRLILTSVSISEMIWKSYGCGTVMC